MTQKKTWHIRAAGLTLATSTALSLGLSGNAFAQEDSGIRAGDQPSSTSSDLPPLPKPIGGSGVDPEDPFGTGKVTGDGDPSSAPKIDLDKYEWKGWPPKQGVEFAPNPKIKDRNCSDDKLNIALVYDISGSIRATGEEEYHKATTSFINSIADKNIGVASFFMGDKSENPQPKPEIVTKKNKASVIKKINDNVTWVNGRGENWPGVLTDVQNNSKKYHYDLVIFIADGLPDKTVEKSQEQHVDEGRVVANKIKKSGTRIVTVGAGPLLLKDVDKSVSNLVQLSGPKKNSDWFLGDWDKLGENLAKTAASSNCKPIAEPTTTPAEEPTTPTTPTTTPTVSPSTVSTTINNTATNTVTETNSVDEVETETSTETEKSVETNTETVNKTETVKPAPETTVTSSVETQVVDKPYPVQQPAQPVYGPKVETGGEVDGTNLVTRIKDILFR